RSSIRPRRRLFRREDDPARPGSVVKDWTPPGRILRRRLSQSLRSPAMEDIILTPSVAWSKKDGPGTRSPSPPGARAGDTGAVAPTAGRAPTRCLLGGSRPGRRPGAVLIGAGARAPTPARGKRNRRLWGEVRVGSRRTGVAIR